MRDLLSASGVESFYGDFQALYGVDFAVGEGETVALVGANGAGKSTLLRTISGLLDIAKGEVIFDRQALNGLAAHRISRLGIAMVPEGRRLFSSLNVEENLTIGASGGREGAWMLGSVFDLFPILRERRRQKATSLSGGQQQMVSIGRALMANPRLLLCDELSLGLAPVVIEEIYGAFPAIKAEGCAIVLVEQDVRRALEVSDRVYCLLEGRVTLSGFCAKVTFDDVSAAYMGASPLDDAEMRP